MSSDCRVSRDHSTIADSSSRIAATAPSASRASSAAPNAASWSFAAAASESGTLAGSRLHCSFSCAAYTWPGSDRGLIPCAARAPGLRPRSDPGASALETSGAGAEGVDGDGLAGLDAHRLAVAAQRDGALADDLGGVGIEIHHDTGVLVDAEYETSVRQRWLEHGQAPLAQVAEPGVVVAALGVVVVWDHRNVEANLCEHVEAVQPVRVDADLVDLVDGHGRPPERERRRRREHDRSARAQLLADRIGDRRAAPLAERDTSGSPGRRRPNRPNARRRHRVRRLTVSPVSSRVRPAACTGRPIASRKYSIAFAARIGAFSWNPNGVSRSTASTSVPSRSKIARWGPFIVGAVSPDPMIARMSGCGHAGGLRRRGGGEERRVVDRPVEEVADRRRGAGRGRRGEPG